MFKKQWPIISISFILVIIVLNLPIIPVGRAQKGKESFVFRVQTKDMLFTLDYEVEETPSNFNYLDLQTVEPNQLIFESNDWHLNIALEPKTIATTTQNVIYFDPPMERLETRIIGLYVELELIYTDKETGITSTFKRVLISEATSGEFNLNDYLEQADDIPIKDFRFSFNQIEIINKETNATITNYEYDPGMGLYIAHILAEVSYDLYYSTTILNSESPGYIAISNLGITFSNQIFSAVVAFLIAYYQIKKGKTNKKENSMTTLKLRFAKGEITKKQYNEMKKTLQE